MREVKPPNSVRNLEAAITRLANDRGFPFIRVRRSIAHTIVGQMLPSGVVKGGSAMRLRVNESEARLTEDFDFSPAAGLDPEAFVEQFQELLATGWHGFSARLVTRKPATPEGVPEQYVMKPYEVKLEFKGSPWCTVIFELGHDEAGSTDDPELSLAPDIIGMFEALGLPTPQPIPIMSVAQQAAQKIHACTGIPELGMTNERAHDLVDLQILHRVAVIDADELGRVAPRLFRYRKKHDWPPVVVTYESWDTLYADAAEDLDVLPTVRQAAAWANKLIGDAAATETRRTV
jgi:hypothetical protein